MTANRRVRVADYGRLDALDGRLWPVPSIRGRQCRLHWAAAAALSALQEAFPLPGLLLVCSGWRAHRWRDRAHYEAELVRRYGSVAEGRKWLAFDSPHETGLACDFGSHGLWPTRKTANSQRATDAYRWLVEHAAGFGFVPYLREPWHWELPVGREVWEMPGPEAR